MTGNRLLWHALIVYSLPLVLVALGGGWGLAILLVLAALVTRWLVGLSGLLVPARQPDLILDTIAASHFVEKVRWCLDRLGVAYVEKPAVGALGAFTLARTVPRLRLRTGAVSSSIGNSPEILRYLYGRYLAEHPEAVRFLEPTESRLALERDIDASGVMLQRWIYYHIVDDRDLALQAWGAEDPRSPLWQRWLVRIVYPLQRLLIRRAFRISADAHERNGERLVGNLETFEARLADGRRTLSGADEPDYTDFAFAAINALWVRPDGYGGGAADGVQIDAAQVPAEMQSEVSSLRQRFPNVVTHIERLYREERSPDA